MSFGAGLGRGERRLLIQDVGVGEHQVGGARSDGWCRGHHDGSVECLLPIKTSSNADGLNDRPLGFVKDQRGRWDLFLHGLLLHHHRSARSSPNALEAAGWWAPALLRADFAHRAVSHQHELQLLLLLLELSDLFLQH